MSTTLFENAESPHETGIQTSGLGGKRARNGAAWLDAKFGPDWDRQIDFEKLRRSAVPSAASWGSSFCTAI